MCNALLVGGAHIARMIKSSEKQGHFLREWRTFRKLTQADVAELVGTTASMINHLENGNRGLSHKWLIRLAPALGTSPGFLLDQNPHALPNQILEIWNRADPAQRAQLIRVAEAIVPRDPPAAAS